MHNNYFIIKDKQEVISLYSRLAYDVFLTGLITYNWIVLQVNTIVTLLDSVEKFILFLCTIAFAAYRIYHLHLDMIKKKIEIKKMKEPEEIKKVSA